MPMGDSSGHHSPAEPIVQENPFAPLVEAVVSRRPAVSPTVRPVSGHSDSGDEMNWGRPPVIDDPQNLAKIWQLRATVNRGDGRETRHYLPTEGSKTVREARNDVI